MIAPIAAGVCVGGTDVLVGVSVFVGFTVWVKVAGIVGGLYVEVLVDFGTSVPHDISNNDTTIIKINVRLLSHHTIALLALCA